MDNKADNIDMIPVEDIKVNPKNPNRHSGDQIERLAELIKYQGFRNPLIISERTGLLVVGHGRLQAAKLCGMKEVPVIYQEFDSEEQEYAYLVSDNAIAEWASLDLSQINADFLDLGPDLDVDMLGLDGFEIDPLGSGSGEEDGDYPGDMDFAREIDEKNDYIVLLFDSKEDYKEAREKLGLGSVKLNLSANGNENMEITGTGRVVEGKSVIDRL